MNYFSSSVSKYYYCLACSVVELVGLVGPEEREVVARVVHHRVHGDDQVPQPGGCDVALSEEGA